MPRWTRGLLLSVAMPCVYAAADAPQTAVDELLAADRAFSAAASKVDVTAGLSAMFADDVMMPTPGGAFVEGKAAAVATLQSNADNATSHVEWTPVRGGISADGRHGFTLGFMTLRRADGTAMPLKYLAYWVKQPGGWRVAVYKRTRAAAAAPSLAVMPPILPQRLVAPSADTAAIGQHKWTLDETERSFSAEARRIGLGAAFARYGSVDAVHLGPPTEPGLVVGPEKISRSVSEGQPPGGSTISWAPDRVIVASSGDLGVTIGMIRPDAPAAGQPAGFPFFTIWRRPTPDAPWRYVAE